ncbi:MAG TPA: outer membrane beta-barrel protein [Novosphingobium sp.]|nr:outer membrane beta-barrel protein [Novosphingobium sp.]
MQKFQYLIGAAATLAALSSPAFAQDRDKSGDFDGVYVSGAVGLATRDSDGTDRVIFDTQRDAGTDNTVTTSTGANAFSPGFCNGSSTANSNATTACTGDDDALEYAVRIGYDKRFGNVVGGVLIEGSKTDASDSTTAFSSTPAGYSFTRGIDYALSARARLGITPGGGGGLFYVTGGGSYARIDHDFSTTNTANSFTANNDDDMVWGWQAGGGAEVMLGSNLSLGLEYLYNRYDDDKYFVGIGTGTAGATNPFVLAGGVNARPSDTSYDFHTFRATLGFQF